MMFRFASIIAFLGMAFLGSVSAQENFAWEIEPEDGYPIIAFDQGNADSEIVFRYNFTGTLSAQKYLTSAIYEDDCTTEADASLGLLQVTPEGNEIQLDVDVDQSTITDSKHYSAPSATTGLITFCVRMDYMYKDSEGNEMSINFHETKVDITVDLTANFTLTGISTDRTEASEDSANADLDYPVEAYFCDDANDEITPDPFAQGSALQVCVKIDDEVVTEDVYVKDILRFVVSQPEGPGTPSVNIAGGTPDPLTAKLCGLDGKCNVKTQLPSKYFVDPNPNDLQVDGIALLAFGSPSRLLRARISGSIAAPDRKLQLSDEEAPPVSSTGEPPFSLEVGLVGAQPAAPQAAPQQPVVATEPAPSNNTAIFIGIICFLVVLIVLMVIGISVYCCCFAGGGSAAKDRRQQEVEEEEMRRRYMAKMGNNVE